MAGSKAGFPRTDPVYFFGGRHSMHDWVVRETIRRSTHDLSLRLVSTHSLNWLVSMHAGHPSFRERLA